MSYLFGGYLTSVELQPEPVVRFLFALLSIEVHAGRFAGFDLPGFEQRQFVTLVYSDDEI